MKPMVDLAVLQACADDPPQAEEEEGGDEEEGELSAGRCSELWFRPGQ